MKFKFTYGLSVVLAFLLSGTFAVAQAPLDIANQHVKANLEEWGLTAQDVEGMTISDMNTDRKTGISRIYFWQHHEGIPVYNAIMNYNITAEGEVFYVGKRFVKELSSKVNTTIPILSAEEAVGSLATHLGLPNESLRLVTQVGENEYLFEKGNIAREDIPVKLMLQPHEGNARLVWDVLLSPVGNFDKWSTRVDAVTGEVLNEYNWTIYCQIDHRVYGRAEHDCSAHTHSTGDYMEELLAGGGTYNVWPEPYESPIHGPRTMVEDPADEIASPFGWHDTDGVDGAEFTITRGNNTHAFDARADNPTSNNDEPDGGTDLIFDFPFDPADEPEGYIDAAVVNLFYWTNYIHDFSYRFGMDEQNANFQQNNYGNGGLGGDPMIARAQAGAETGSANNAFYSHSNDGNSGSINMFVWGNNGGAEFLTVSEPNSVEGTYPTILISDGDWGAGAYVEDNPVLDKEVVIVEDMAGSPTDGCEELVNAAEVEGKIALVDRGSCFFSTKAFYAEQAGAVGVIICNIEGVDPPGAMANGGGEDVNIPTVMISFEDCAVIRQFVGNGLVVSLTDPTVGQTGPDQLDGDLDNGIIAHEYGHGVSIRLTGGGNQACLNNGEQMGEGWSDWLALVTTVQPGDTGDKPRGVGTYATGEDTDGGGIRRYPYSTDMSVSPLTYGDVAGNTGVHPIGEVWANMVWDLYWSMVDKYGWSEDPYDETSGNHRAIRLVYEGMKTQACNPGFITGRDAIIAADNALYGGENYCDIWKVFARRGAGELAIQGTTDSATDQVEDFTEPCECRDAITISKSVTDFIQPGEDIMVTLQIDNCKVAGTTETKVTDEIPAGTEFIPGSSNIPATVDGNLIVFDLGNLAFQDAVTIEYRLSTAPDQWSEQFWIDEVLDDGADDNWEVSLINDDSPSIWQISDDFGGYTGDWSWEAANADVESQHVFSLTTDAAWEVTGDRPTLRFFHMYNTQGGFDGGFVEVKTVDEDDWQTVNDKWYRNGYDLEFPYSTLALPFIGAYSGNSGGMFEASYLDLSDWIGETIQVRFHYASDETIGDAQNGWQVDDIEFLNLLSYNGEACLTTAEGDNRCVTAPEEGTIVDSGVVSDASEQKLEGVTLTTFPNPAADVLNVSLNTENTMELNISLLTVEGREFMTQTTTADGTRNLSFDVSEVPSGFYFIRVSSGEGTMTEKVIIE